MQARQAICHNIMDIKTQALADVHTESVMAVLCSWVAPWLRVRVQKFMLVGRGHYRTAPHPFLLNYCPCLLWYIMILQLSGLWLLQGGRDAANRLPRLVQQVPFSNQFTCHCNLSVSTIWWAPRPISIITEKHLCCDWYLDMQRSHMIAYHKYRVSCQYAIAWSNVCCTLTPTHQQRGNIWKASIPSE